MSNLDIIFEKLTKFANGTKGSGVNSAGSIWQLTVGTYSVIIGRDTLRLTLSDNEKNALIAFTPSKTSVGTFERDIELELVVFGDDDNPESHLKETYSRLHVDGGELFQFSTVHDFDFLILPELYTKYLELLKVMKDSNHVGGEKLSIDEGISNLTAAVELYNKEA